MMSPTLEDWLKAISGISKVWRTPHYAIGNPPESSRWRIYRADQDAPSIIDARATPWEGARQLTTAELAIYQQALILASGDAQ